VRRGRRREARPPAGGLLAGRGTPRLDILDYISHGVTKTPVPPANDGSSPGSGGAPAGAGEEDSPTARDPLSAYTTNLTERARQGRLGPPIGRAGGRPRTLGRVCRPRTKNPGVVGGGRGAKTAQARGPPA